METEKAEVFENETRSGKHGAAIWQLLHPQRHNPTYLLNAVPKLPGDLRMCVPKKLLQRRTPYGDLQFAANITPMHTVVDLHIDQCRDGLIQCIGQSKKLIIMWPLTEANKVNLEMDPNCPMKYSRIGPKLGGGIITIIDSSVTLLVPTGTVHGTVTMQGGGLVGINYIAIEGHHAGARCFRYELNTNLDDIKDILPIYADQLEASLGGNDRKRHQIVLKDWLTIYPRLLTLCEKSEKKTVHQLQRVSQAFKDLFKGPCRPEMSCCACEGDQFEGHFKAEHLESLERLIARQNKRRA